jgi:hypothetical protein
MREIIQEATDVNKRQFFFLQGILHYIIVPQLLRQMQNL